MRENGGSFDFNFISSLNPAVDENWFADIVCCSSSSKNYATYEFYDALIYSNFLWMVNLLNVSTFFVMTFLLFSSAHIIDHELQSGHSIILAL